MGSSVQSQSWHRMQVPGHGLPPVARSDIGMHVVGVAGAAARGADQHRVPAPLSTELVVMRAA
eukprot:586245-Rhodomonas_salina.2